jgi:hypothetical protein
MAKRAAIAGQIKPANRSRDSGKINDHAFLTRFAQNIRIFNVLFVKQAPGLARQKRLNITQPANDYQLLRC